MHHVAKQLTRRIANLIEILVFPLIINVKYALVSLKEGKRSIIL